MPVKSNGILTLPEKRIVPYATNSFTFPESLTPLVVPVLLSNYDWSERVASYTNLVNGSDTSMFVNLISDFFDL